MCLVERVFGDELLEFLEADGRRGIGRALGLAVRAGVAVVAGRLLQRMGGAQAVADVGHALAEVHVLLDEVLVHRAALDDVVADVVEDRQVRLRLEDQFAVGQLARAVREGGQHVQLDVLGRQAAVGHARPQDGMHLGHVRAPQHEGVGVLAVVIATHGLVDAEGAHEAGHGRGHAMACVRVEVVGAEAGLPQLGGRVAFPDGPLAGTEHADVARAARFQGGLALLLHDVECLVPGDVGELAVLVELAVLHAQQRLRETVLAVHDFGQEVTLDAVQALVHRGVRVALGGHHAAVLDADEHAATGAAEPAGALVPADVVAGAGGLRQRLRAGDADANGRGCSGDSMCLDEVTTGYLHFTNS